MKIKYALAALSLVAVLALVSAEANALFGFGKYKTVEAEVGVVTIPVADVNDGKAHYFVFKDNGVDIKFFIVKSADGVIRAAFDACDVCYLEKKGYSQEGDFMICNNCGMRFHSTRINEVKGGCNPSPLARSYDQNNVTITKDAILSGRRYFS